MEHVKFVLELIVNGLALFIVFAVLVSLIGGAVGFVLWLIDKIREESHGN